MNMLNALHPTDMHIVNIFSGLCTHNFSKAVVVLSYQNIKVKWLMIIMKIHSMYLRTRNKFVIEFI